MSVAADPVGFLRATHDAAQAKAEAAAERAWSPHWEYDDLVRQVRDLNNGNELANIYFPEIGAHVEANDPAAVLRRIAADRKLIAEHGVALGWDGENTDGSVCATCAQDGLDGGRSGDPYPCTTVRLIAEGWGWKKAGG